MLLTVIYPSEDSKSWRKAVGKTKTLSFPVVLTFTANHKCVLRALHWDTHFAEDKPLWANVRMNNMHAWSPAGLGSAHWYMPWATTAPCLFTPCSEFPTSNCQFAGAVCNLTVFAQHLKIWSTREDLNPQDVNFCNLWHTQVLLLSPDSILLSEWPLHCVHEKTDPGVRSSTDTTGGHHLIVILNEPTSTECFLTQNCSNFQAVSGLNQGLYQVGSEAGCELCVTAMPHGPSNDFTMAEDSPLHGREMQCMGWAHSAMPTGLTITSPLVGCTHRICLPLPWLPFH